MTVMDDFACILEENLRRREAAAVVYDPVGGRGCCGRRVALPSGALVPEEMIADQGYRPGMPAVELARLRCRHDFEYWAATCVRIKDKITGRDMPLVLNRPQRRVVSILEAQRRRGEPLRMIMLKARQWGGSTLVQMYMAWIQTVHRTNWHSLICAHVKDTSSSIRGIYTKMLASYPQELWEGDDEPRFVAFERSVNTRLIAGRGCRVTLGSSENQEAVRGSDYAMAHLSEVAFWSDTRMRSPEGFVRAICGAIARVPYTLIVMESTANGVGNFFHTEWLRACSPEGSDKEPVFVPWHEIEIYAETPPDPRRLWDAMDDYERALWHRGLTLEQICWYHNKRREYPSHRLMMAEYPTTDVEAFANTGAAVFAPADVERLRAHCRPPVMTGDLRGRAVKGAEALRGLRFVADGRGALQVWEPPCGSDVVLPRDAYIVTVDVGGRADSSDWSVIAVLDRRPVLEGEPPVIAAQWRGHIDHDLLAWKSAMIAQWYHRALLVVESNTIETESADTGDGMYLLSQLNRVYPNMYCRVAPDSVRGEPSSRLGFHTNRSTKALVISELIAQVRDCGYEERSSEACDEMITYRTLPNGGYAASQGHHDDILMTRAIGLYVASADPLRPRSDMRCLVPGAGAGYGISM